MLPWQRKTLFLSCNTCAQFSSILTIVLVLTLSHKTTPVCVCILRPVEMLAGGNFMWGHFGTEGRVGWAQSCSSNRNSKINTDLMNDATYNFTSENSFISYKFRPVQWNLSIKDTLNKETSLMRTLSAVPTT